MLHLVLYGLLAVIVAVGLFLLATRFLPAGEQIAPPVRDEPPWELPPDRSLQAADVDAVRLPVALRGYRFAETDILLDRLAGELRSRDEEIARLRGRAEDATDEDTAATEPERYAPPPPTAAPADDPDPGEPSAPGS
ncbi:MAG TPA: hypothetical protein VFU35_13740 [Jatrophihabitans sp.]|nr:hypothetical protein [Jatrophihabitans sp.]